MNTFDPYSWNWRYRNACQCSDRTLLEYFMAHAPKTPAPWFEPKMPPKPKLPALEEISLERVRIDVGYSFEAETDPETAEGVAWVQEYRNSEEALDQWKKERRKQQFVQWPRAWAEELIADLNRPA